MKPTDRLKAAVDQILQRNDMAIHHPWVCIKRKHYDELLSAYDEAMSEALQGSKLSIKGGAGGTGGIQIPATGATIAVTPGGSAGGQGCFVDGVVTVEIRHDRSRGGTAGSSMKPDNGGRCKHDVHGKDCFECFPTNDEPADYACEKYALERERADALAKLQRAEIKAALWDSYIAGLGSPKDE